MIGVIALVTGNAEWGIRFAALLLGTATLAIIHRIAHVLFDALTAFLTAVLVLLTITNAGLNLFLTIDSLLLLCCALAQLMFWLVVRNPAYNTRWLTLASPPHTPSPCTS